MVKIDLSEHQKSHVWYIIKIDQSQKSDGKIASKVKCHSWQNILIYAALHKPSDIYHLTTLHVLVIFESKIVGSWIEHFCCPKLPHKQGNLGQNFKSLNICRVIEENVIFEDIGMIILWLWLENWFSLNAIVIYYLIYSRFHWLLVTRGKSSTGFVARHYVASTSAQHHCVCCQTKLF